VYLVKSYLTQFFNDLLTLQLKNAGLPVTQPVQANNRSKYIGQLPDYLKAIFTSLLEALTQKNCEGFLRALTDNSREIPAVSLIPFNKKTKKIFLSRLQETSSAELKQAVERSDLPTVFNCAVRVRLLDGCQVYIPLPTDSWANDLMATIYEKAFSLQDDTTLQLWRLRDSHDPSELLQSWVKSTN
jgi:hypothetical protein